MGKVGRMILLLYTFEKFEHAAPSRLITFLERSRGLPCPHVGDAVCWQQGGCHWRGQVESRVIDLASNKVELWLKNIFRM